jgi:hypothetical protein
MLSEASYHNMTVGRIPSVEGGIQPTIVDAKGDLIAAVAADSLNRLAVGSNDQVLVADSAASTGLAWKSYATPFAAGKNKIINGDFAINQRGFTSNTTTNTYNFDRWRQNNAGTTGTFTTTPQTFTPGTAPIAGYEGSTFLQGITAAGASTNTLAIISQPIEDVRTFAGQTATISFFAQASTGSPKIGMEIAQNFGSGGSPSTQVLTSISAITISTSWARYSVTVSVPSISGKTIGTTANTSSLAVNFWLSAGSDFNARASSIGLQNNTFQMWGVQVESGSTATAFQTASGSIGGELALCQRYYQTLDEGSMCGRVETASAATLVTTLPVAMRTLPSSTLLTGTNSLLVPSVAFYTVTGIASLSGVSGRAVRIQFTGASGMTAGNVIVTSAQIAALSSEF